MDLEAISGRAAAHRLGIFGGFAAEPDDGLPPGTRTVLLLGPEEPGFWTHVSAQPEYHDGAPDPMDRWSRRVISVLAADVGAEPLFPFGGPPFLPFYSWALRSGRAFASPVQLLVHDRAGLFLSYRGALALKAELALPPPQPPPCTGCAAPCLSACPAGALGVGGYDLAACHAWLDTSPGAGCLAAGCAVRRACPLSQSYGRLPAQSAFHMKQFHHA